MVVLVESGFVAADVKCPSLLQLRLERGAFLAVQARICLGTHEGNNFSPTFDRKEGRRGGFGGVTLLSSMVMVPQLNFLCSSQ